VTYVAKNRAKGIRGIFQRAALTQIPTLPLGIRLGISSGGKTGGYITRLERMRRRIRTKKIKNLRNNVRKLRKRF